MGAGSASLALFFAAVASCFAPEPPSGHRGAGMAESAVFLPSQGSLKPVTEIGSVVPAGLLAIQRVPWGGPINHICSLLSLAGSEDSRQMCGASVCVGVCECVCPLGAPGD